MTAYERLCDALADRLDQVNGTRARARCPGHDGESKTSLAITAIEGQTLVCCHAGCQTADVLAALNLTMADLFDNPKGATYRYDNGRTVQRSPDKRFWQGSTGKPPELYRLAKVKAAVAAGKAVFVVEGEKDVHALESLGVTATCAPMGAGKWSKVDPSPLYGGKVLIVADQDEPGRKHAAEVLASLRGKADAAVYAPKVGKDAADHIAAGYGAGDFVPVEPIPTSLSSWEPVNLAPILDGTRPRLQPTILTRTDRQGLWYPGRTHALVGESESAKSWIVQYACTQQMLAGHNIVYLDFEDSAEAVTDRMLILGMTPELLRDRFGYIAPEEPVDPAGRGPLTQALGDLRPILVIIDGVTEAMSLHRLKSVDNDDLATFGRIITRPIAATGAATVNLDHQPKATDNRGRYALGGVHKLNGLSGVSIIAENIEPMGVGLRGVTRLRIAKDRPGQLRAHGLPSAGLRWIGDFILDTSILVEPALIRPPVEVAKAADEWRPTEVMRKVCDAMTKAGKPLSQKDILDRVKARANITRRALAILVDEKFIDQNRGPHNAQLHTLVTPYRGDDE